MIYKICILPTDDLTANGAKPSPGTVLTSKLHLYHFTALALGKFEGNLRSAILVNFSDWWPVYLLWNCPQTFITGPCRWLVNIGSGNGLVSSSNKAITWANFDPDPCRHMTSPWYKLLWISINPKTLLLPDGAIEKCGGNLGKSRDASRLTHLPLVPQISVSESGQQCFR